MEIPQDEPGHVYHLFVCRSRERDAIRAALDEAGIASATYYTTPLHLQPSLRFLGYEPGSLPATEQAGAENFSLPLWPGIPAEAQERVVDVVRVGASRVASDAPAPLPAPALAARSSTRRSSRRRGGSRSSSASTTARTSSTRSLLDRTILLVVGIKLIVFIAFGFYNRWWRYVSIRDMWATVRGVVVACLVADLTVYLVQPVHSRPPAAVDRRDRPPPHARLRRGLAPARPHGRSSARA